MNQEDAIEVIADIAVLLTKTNKVEVEIKDDGKDTPLIYLTTTTEEHGRILGKKGKNINAMRIIAAAIGECRVDVASESRNSIRAEPKARMADTLRKVLVLIEDARDAMVSDTGELVTVTRRPKNEALRLAIECVFFSIGQANGRRFHIIW